MRRNIWNTTLLTFLALTAVCCGGNRSHGDSSRVGPAQMNENEFLLAQPYKQARKLLGLPVIRRPEGGFEIGQARLKGCQVTPHPSVPMKNEGVYHQEGDKISGMASDFNRIAYLESKYQEVGIEAMVTNVEEYSAELNGLCGHMAIKSVKVGTGKFDFQHRKTVVRGVKHNTEDPFEKSKSEGEVSYQWASTGEWLAWDTPQAWAVSVAVSEGEEQAEIDVRLPQEITTGQHFRPEITVSTRDLWLIVVACRYDKKCWILLPSPLRPTQIVSASETLVLDPIRASEPVMEQLIVYGFHDEKDYLRFSPRAGNLTEEASAAYVKDIDYRLEKNREIAPDRWIKKVFSYVVERRSESNSKQDEADKFQIDEDTSEIFSEE